MTRAETEPQRGKEEKSPISLKGKIVRFTVGPVLVLGGSYMIGDNISSCAIATESIIPKTHIIDTVQLNSADREIVGKIDQALRTARENQPEKQMKPIEIPISPDLEQKIESVQAARSNQAREMQPRLAQGLNLSTIPKIFATFVGFLAGAYGIALVFGAKPGLSRK